MICIHNWWLVGFSVRDAKDWSSFLGLVLQADRRFGMHQAATCRRTVGFTTGGKGRRKEVVFVFPKSTWEVGHVLQITLSETNISPFWRQFWVDDFPLPKVEYFSSLEGIRTSLIGFLNLLWIGIGFFSCCVFDAKAYDFEANLSEFWSEAEDPASKNTTKRSEKLNGYRNPPFPCRCNKQKEPEKTSHLHEIKTFYWLWGDRLPGCVHFYSRTLAFGSLLSNDPLEGGGDSGVIGQSVALWWLLASLEG